ncbi:non-SMC mitotic condensation complex subunit 1-domain-containing protein [Irpex lacteus]|nr:non-SMC mitotic condensation complex subunit 1-domain-containing protein [Irpex lacteus]
MESFELQEEIQGLQDLSTYEIPNEHDIPSMDGRTVAMVLEQAVEAVADSSDAIADPNVFDSYRSLLKYAEKLQGTTMSKVLDSISSGFQTQVDATLRDSADEDEQAIASRKMVLEMYAFLLHMFVLAAERVKDGGDEDVPVVATKGRRGRGGKTAAARSAAARRVEQWSWQEHIPNILGLIAKVFKIKTQRIWVTTGERDTFISCITAPIYRITENEGYMKIEAVRLGVYKTISLAVKHHGHGVSAQISIMQNLQYYDHLSEYMAELLFALASQYDHTQLCDDLLRDIAAKSFSAQDTKGPRHFSRFLVKLAELLPRAVLKQISLLLAHLDSEAYPMRIAIVEVIGQLIREIATSEEVDASQAKKQLNGLYELLLERVLDLSSYVRTKVLSTLAKLCDLPVKFPKQRLAITKAAVDSLEDKTATVRKSAVQLLVQLIVTHPYGLIHGGLLSLQEWEERYQETCRELKKVEDVIGKAVERAEGEGDEESEKGEDGEEDEEEEEEEEGEGEDGEAGPSKRKKGKKRAKNPDDDSMDVDGEEEDNDNGEEEDAEADSEDVTMEDGDSENGEGSSQPKKPKKKKKPRKSELNLEALQNEAVVAALQDGQIQQMRLKRRYYAECLNFIRQIEGGMKIVEDLLASNSKAEVLEGMEFFRVIHEYQFDGAEAGIKKMLHLIWSKDNSSTSEDGKELKGIRPRLLECYRNLYFDAVPGMEPKQQVNRIAKNMIELTYDASLAELTSLEEMMRIMMEDDQVHPDVIGKLWQVYSSERPLPRAQRRGAVIILGMLALARRSVVADRADVLMRIGLGKLGQADLTLARYTCVALQRLSGSAKKVKGSLLDKNIRLEMDNPLFKKLQEALERKCRHKDWFSMAEQAINTVYALAERPDLFCDRLIKNLAKKAFDPEKEEAEPPAPQPERDPEAMDEDAPAPANEEPASSQGQGDKNVGDAFALAQLLFVVGHVAIKHIVFLELVEREWKRQKAEREAAEKAAKGRTDGKQAKDQGEELDQVAGNAEDEIGERVAAMRETELLYGEHSLLTVFGPMLIHICGNPGKYKNRTLRAAATLAFSKFLCVSSQFCDKHHDLLFRILKSSKDASIRSNIVIALGDVAVSFSTIIDENSSELYRGLSDKDIVVKKNTLMVLTHLILNGMIKVKGQLGEMAKCIEDPDQRIADLARLFFSELATKDNAIYNNLPDVISHLSVGAHAVDEETFQSIMKYVFTFIEKEKQAENIVEKLCQRFRLAEEPRQWRDIAYCLSLLPFKSERSVKKLIEGLQFYRDKLHEEEVYNRFQEILAKARTSKTQNKPDAELNEFEAILEEHKQQGKEEQALEKRVEGKKAAAKRRAARRPPRRKATQTDAEDD